MTRMVQAADEPAGRRPPVAVLLPGSGSSTDFVRRAFGPALARAGYALVTVEPGVGSGAVEAALRALAAAVTRHRADLVGGVSLGAHVAACWAAGLPARPAAGATPPPRGLLLALPAWTGPPGAVAAASARAADEVRRHGAAGALARARDGAVPWVADELAAAWPAYGHRLAATLAATAASAGPTRRQLRGIRLPAGLVAFADDPLHPAAVADEWAELIGYGSVDRLAVADLAADRGRLGAAALTALARAVSAARAGGPTAARSSTAAAARPAAARRTGPAAS